MMNYFVNLADKNCTINLAHLTFVEWDVPVKDERGRVTGQVTTVSLSGGGGFYLSERDSWTLRKALQDFNAREREAGAALPALNRICDALFWLAGVGYEQPVTGVGAGDVGSGSASSGSGTGTNSRNSARSSGTSHEDARILGVKGKREYTGVTN